MMRKHIFRLAIVTISTLIASFHASAASAADLAVPAATAVNWDGVYGGIQGAIAAGSASWSSPAGYFASERGQGVPPDVAGKGQQNGLLGGLQLGYNRQFGAYVLGLEADASFGPLDGYAVCGGTVGLEAPETDPYQRGSGDPCHVSTNWLASATGRFGYAFGRVLAYAKGGMAFAGDRYDIYNPTAFSANPAQGNAGLFGWTLGAGLEYALGGNWSVKAEYDYYDFGTRTIGFNVPGYLGFNSFSIRRYENLAKFGLNYRFADTGGGDVSAPAPAIVSDFTGEFGGRLGISSGRFREHLYSNFNGAQLVSRLTWPDQTGVSLESFARADHISGLFAKGDFGGIDLFGAHMNDEDFPPDHYPYSNTLSPTYRGRDLYASADLGYSFLRANTWSLGGFVGYHYYSERMNAYGLTQQAPQSSTSKNTLFEPNSAITLGQTEYWQALRVGLGGDVMLTDRLKLYAEAVWLPYMSYTGKDNHWLRANINPQYDYGQGYNGFQTEAVLSYALTDRINVGVGARYWDFRAQRSSSQFPGALGRSPEGISSSRTGGFLQASYKFGDVAAAPVVAKY